MFEEVGNAVKEFASDNATVVVGTVIDPEVGEDLKVTVVATGLGQIGEGHLAVKESAAIKQDGSVDYKQMDRPTVFRQQKTARPQEEAVATEVAEGEQKEELEYLDIPAFLRRQAD